MSVFETLSKINVNDKVEKKNGLSYLPWAWAWSVAKQNYPSATYKVYENEDGFNYHHDGMTGWVKTGVTIEGMEMIEYLPIMDYRNQSIRVDKITSFHVNSSIQRSLTKALARHGLGLYIYAGEDLPEEEPQTTKSTESPKPKKIKLDIGDDNWDKVLRYVTANKDKGLTEILKTLATKYIIVEEIKDEIKKKL